MIRVRKYGWSNKVWRGIELGFGDTWAVTNFLLRVSLEIKEPVKVFTSSLLFKKNVCEIVNYLDTNGKITFVTTPPQVAMSYRDIYRIKFFPTKKVWRCDSNIIAYQFDGTHLSQFKNLIGDSLNKFLNCLKRMGYLPINVGGYSPLNGIINILTKSVCFVGCPSGISKVAISVGVPTYVITKNIPAAYCCFMQNCHFYNKPVRMFKYTRSFVKHLSCTKGSNDFPNKKFVVI